MQPKIAVRPVMKILLPKASLKLVESLFSAFGSFFCRMKVGLCLVKICPKSPKMIQSWDTIFGDEGINCREKGNLWYIVFGPFSPQYR